MAKYTKLSSKKSRTIGIVAEGGRTKFKKVEFQAEMELNDDDDPVEKRKELSTFIDNYLNEQK